jgi:hypothetical protein
VSDFNHLISLSFAISHSSKTSICRALHLSPARCKSLRKYLSYFLHQSKFFASIVLYICVSH